MFLIITDACSKWIEAVPTTSATSAATIEVLQAVFARFGLPELVVSDSGQCFVSEEFKSFLARNGIKQLTTAPYHPSSNGLAERAVQVVKRGLKKNVSGSLNSRLARTLLSYRTTPHTTTGVTPAELMLGRRPRIRLDLVKPNIAKDVALSQTQSKFRHDSGAQSRKFETGDKVYVKNFAQGKRWLPGTVRKTEGTVILEIQLNSGSVLRRHKDHVRLRVESSTETDTVQSSALDAANTVPVPPDDATTETDHVPQTSETSEQSNQGDSNENVSESESPSLSPESNSHARPIRNRRPIDRFDNSWS